MMQLRGHCVVLLGLIGSLGCSPYATLKEIEPDCSAEDGYEFKVVNAFENTSESAWWSSSDSTPGASASTKTAVETMPDGPRCGSSAAAVLSAAHNDDWGCLFGSNNFANLDASAYDGLSFWARNPGNTTKGFQVLLNDPNTAIGAGLGNCIDLGSGGAAPTTIPVTIDGQTVSTSGSVTRPTLPNECGNSYNVVMLATSDWQLYLIPFGQFQQDPKPNRVPNALLTDVGKVPGTGLLTDHLLSLIIRMPKEAIEELWIDNLGFYRKKSM